jgi:error-prone DNA polymerase
MAEHEYVELNTRSAFSFLQGASVPEEYVAACQELGIRAIALADLRAEEERNEAAILLAQNLKLPLVATNGVRYSRPERREILDVFTCIHHKRTLDTAGRLLTPNAERYLKSATAMNRIFADFPEAIAHTREISARLEFTMNDLGYRFPPYPVPAGETMDSYLRALVDQYAPQRFPSFGPKHRGQLETELALIGELGLAGYFLIVWDIVRFCREHGILAQGRGSAGNSAVCFALGITAVDPIKYELLFARFLSPDRGEWPDIDIDLPSGREREQVIQYVYERYGRYGAAMCANAITYRGRSAIREVGKVLGFNETSIAKLSSLSPLWGWKGPDDTIRNQFQESGLELDSPRVRKFFELVEAIPDLPGI